MKRILALGISILLAPLLSFGNSMEDNYDVFIPIAKYIRQGDADKLAAWFNDTLEISIKNKSNTCSKHQAKQIVKSFFESYKPRDFEINHTAGRGAKKYAIGDLDAGGEKFEVTIYVNLKKSKNYLIDLLQINKKDY